MVEIKINLGGLGTMTQRRHGPLGIPPSVRQGKVRAIPSQRLSGTTASKGKGRSNLVVEQVLQQGREKEKEITDMLNTLLKAGLTEGVMPEFDRLTEQLSEVQRVISNALDKLGL